MSTADPAATILLVEDDAPTRTFLADNLTADGYELLVAECARDGLRLLETKFPDVALVDLLARRLGPGHRPPRRASTA